MFRRRLCSPLAARCTFASALQPSSAKSRLSLLSGMWVLMPLFCLGLFVTGARAQTAHFSYAESTVAGNFTGPIGVAGDSAGNVYIVGTGSSQVMEVPAGCTSTACVKYLGSGFPGVLQGVAVDSTGDVYVTSSGLNPVEEIPVSCINGANNSTCMKSLGGGFNSAMGIAVDSSGDVYVADLVNNAVKEIPLSCINGTNDVACVKTLGGGFATPEGVAVDSAGNVYVADTGNRVVKEIPLSCINGTNDAACVKTLGGGFGSATGVGVDSLGNVFVADATDNAVKEIPVSCINGANDSACVTTLGTFTNGPVALAVDSHDDIYFANQASNLVVKLATAGVDFYSEPVGSTSAAQTLTFTFDTGGTIGTLRALTMGAPNLDFAVASGGTCDGGGTFAAGATCTVNVTFTPKYPGLRRGAVELTTTTAVPIATVYVYGVGDGPHVTFAPPAQSNVGGGFSQPSSTAVDGAGNIYVADSGNRLVKEIPAGCSTSSCVTTLGGGFTDPFGVAVDGAGNVYVADLSSNLVQEMPPGCTSSSCVTTLGVGASQSTVFSSPTGITVDGSGNVYVANFGNNLVQEMPPGCSSNSCVTTLGGGFSEPYDVAVDSNGNVYVADYGNGAVKEMPAGCASSSCVTVRLDNSSANNLNPTDFAPTSVAVDGAGDIYVVDYNGGLVGEIPPGCSLTKNTPGSCTISTLVSGLGAHDPTGLALDRSGNLYLADYGANVVKEIDRADAPGLSFAATNVGATSSDSPKTATVENIGNQELTFQVPTTAGAFNPSVSANFNYDNSSTCKQNGSSAATAYTLASGANCTVAINFAPTVAGSISGQAVLTDDSGSNDTALQYTTQSISLSGTGVQLTLSPTAGALPAGTVGVVYSSQTFTAGGGTGPYQYTATGLPPGLTLNAGTGVLSGTPTAAGNYTPTVTVMDATHLTLSQNYTLAVSKGTPTISTPPTASNLTYGQTLSESTLTGGTGSVAGTFAWTTPTTKPPLGTTSYSVTFTPTDTTDYNTTTVMVPVTVTKATTTISAPPTASNLTYGQTLSDSTLTGGTSSVPGAFTWTTPTTKPPVGTTSYSVTFTPTDTTDYNTTTVMVPVTVTKATTTITAPPTASNLTYGQTLADSTLTGGTGSVAGTFAWTTPTTKPPVGTTSYSVTFTPTDTTDYNTTTVMVPVTVTKATTTITTPPTASNLTYGQTLADSTLTGGAGSVAGTFAWTTPTTKPPVGTTSYSVTFTPTDTTDYNTTTVMVPVTVTKATLTITANNATRVYGAVNPAFSGTVTGAINGDTFTESFTTTATQTSNVGTYSIVPSVTGANVSDYTLVVTDGTLTVTKAATATTLSASASSLNAGQSVTLTAQVTDTSAGSTGTPDGTVNFYDGTTLLGTATLNAGTATFTTSTLAAGVTHSLTASYSGSANFMGSTSSSAISIPVAAADFSFNITGGQTQTVTPGSAASFTFQTSPIGGAYPGPVSFSVSGLPSGATATFTPSTIAANGGTQTVTLSIQTASAVAKNSSGSLFRDAGGATLAMGLLLLPLFGLRRRKAWTRMICIALLLLGGGIFTTLATGCGSPNGFSRQQQQSYTVTVTATSGSVTKTAAVTLNVQ